MKSTHHYWLAENTGWSNGISWFTTSGEISYPTREAAEQANENHKNRMNQSTTKYRVTFVEINKTSYDQ